jgi:sulfatase maturation enzyme AslB (radical SAM superfamily)
MPCLTPGTPFRYATRDVTDTFCIRPFEHLCLNLDGTAQLCCRASQPVSEGSRALSLSTDSYEEIWRSTYMQRARESLLSGRHIPDCVACYSHEKTAGTSLRIESNIAWLRRQPAGERETAESRLRASSEAAGYTVSAPPRTLHLWFGSHCNLQCRMCNAEYSTRIAADPVHAAWHPGGAIEPKAPSRIVDASTWSDSESVLFGEVFRDVDGLEAIAFAGGEPLFQKQIEPLLEFLIRKGRAPRVRLFVSTNGTFFRTSLMEKLDQFQEATMAVSLDGVGSLNDYIRYPARWPAIVANIGSMRSFPRIRLRVDPTLQAYNLLGLVDLLRFCDGEGLEVSLSNILQGPAYLAMGALPEPCLAVARERLEAYLRSCPPRNAQPVEGVLAHLRTVPAPDQPRLLEELMTFTNDLDASRGQRIHDATPELLGLLEAAGFPWKPTRRFMPVALFPA